MNLAGKRRTDILIEANAGVGKITKYVLRLSSKRLIIYDRFLHPDLQALLNVYSNRVQRYDKNLIGVTNFGPASEHFNDIRVFSGNFTMQVNVKIFYQVDLKVQLLQI